MIQSLKKFTQKINLKAENIRHYGIFLGLFGILKISTFTAPLLLSNFVVEKADYGLIEYALSLGLMLVPFLNLGLSGAYPYFNIKEKREGFKSIFYLHGLIVIGFFIVIAVFYLLGIIPVKYFLALMMSTIVVLQLIYSTILKSHAVIKLAVLIDGGLYIVINILNLCLFLGYKFSTNLLLSLLSVYLSVLSALYLYQFFKKTFLKKSHYKEALEFGLPLLLTGFLMLGLATSARVVIEYFLGLDAVAEYSFYFRISGVVIMIHQVVNIAFFKKIYEANPNVLDKYFSMFIAGITMISILLWLIVPFFIKEYFSIFQETYESRKALYFILSMHMSFWIGMALNENIIYRERLVTKLNLALFIVMVLMIASFFMVSYLGDINIEQIAIINTLAVFCSIEFQFYYLKKERGFNFYKTRIANAAGILLLLIIYNLL